jgi:SLOG cluster2
MPKLLPSEALRGMRIAISVSESPDLDRLGLLEIHFRLALGEIARSVLVSGGTLAYGGHMRRDGYTTFLIQELQKYGRRDSPLLICLAWQEHRELKLSEIETRADDLGLLGRIVCLDPDGAEIDPAREREEAAQSIADPALRRRALTGMRLYMATHTRGRVLLGGKRSGFQGEIPGLMEEALISLANAHPVYLAGGFGGVTTDIARALGVDDGAWLPPLADAPPPDPRWEAGRKRLVALAAEPTWAGLKNGLSDKENRRLAASHRPSDIAALVSLGLGRMSRGVHT